ncbi:hypothetical protein C1H46_002782 [Malus baccata]|uniref:Uncharacterized protein n=1 Tax=Malus baccata TaxID=106549 RepID=A0A540NM33_MALBA|nr:hypothetical protein C1H46_002782 [Malus baccata]
MEWMQMILQDGAEVLSGSGSGVKRRVEATELAVDRPGSGEDGQRPKEPIGMVGRSKDGGYAELEG